ncbi:hypothetical protein J1614_000025 [Plenodomus biglobosus]|nr:hypothetical protein J1614_000025 [Plenodomus biglobosus]
MAHALPTIPRRSHGEVIRRIDGLVNKLALAVLALNTGYCLLSEVHHNRNVDLYVRERESKVDDIFESEDKTTLEGRNVLLSYDKNALPIAISEVHIHGVIPEKIGRLCCEREEPRTVADIHTMLKFTSTDPALHSLLGAGGAYSDPSSWQYRQEQGLRKAWSYPVDKISPHKLTDKAYSLGKEYQKQLISFVECRSHPSSDTNHGHYNSTEAYIRTINNALNNTMEELGGPEYISTSGDDAWQAVEERLVKAAKDAVTDLELGEDWDNPADTYGRKADVFLLIGHRDFVEALDLVSHLWLAELLSQ